MNPIKLIIFLVVLGIVIFFVGFNLKNVSDISFGFHTLEDVPIFISLFIAFAAGVVVMLPFTFRRKKKIKPDKKEMLESPEIDEASE
jgi:hypothetical protein